MAGKEKKEVKDKIATFWNDKDEPTRKEIAKVLSGYLKVPISSFLVEVDFDGLPVLQKNLLESYYEQYILPQKGQQIRFDGIIHEKMPSELACPRCGAPAIQTTTKRGIHYKCQNPKCGWDGNRVFDFSRDSRKRYVARCAQILKDMFPWCNIIGNFPYSPDAVLTGIFKEGVINYDLGVYYMGNKLQRLRVELNQHLTQEQFMNTDQDVYVIGRKTIVEKLADRDGIVVHFLIDEPKNKIGMSRLKKIKKTCPKTDDKFRNIQYVIPKARRMDIVTFEEIEMKEMLGFGKYFDVQTKNMLIK